LIVSDFSHSQKSGADNRPAFRSKAGRLFFATIKFYVLIYQLLRDIYVMIYLQQRMPSHQTYCLDEVTRRAARIALADYDAVRVPYICQLSGAAEEILLISRFAAKRMVAATKGSIDIDEARVLALVHITTLCVSDIADLLHMPGQKALQILEDLVQRELVLRHEIEGVRCFMQTDGEVHRQFTDLALGALPA